MLTPAQLAAESITPEITDTQIMNILLLVKRFPLYVYNLALFPDLEGLLAAEKATPTIKTVALKAVLTAVGNLPEVVVESQGRVSAPSHFTSDENWSALALDVLNLFYAVPAGALTRQSFALAFAPIEDLMDTESDLDAVLGNSLLRK